MPKRYPGSVFVHLILCADIIERAGEVVLYLAGAGNALKKAHTHRVD